jgi:hypothetical protein
MSPALPEVNAPVVVVSEPELVETRWGSFFLAVCQLPNALRTPDKAEAPPEEQTSEQR